mgnify:CR=1 FL=1
MEILQLSSRGNLNYPGGMRLWWFSRGAFLGEKYQPNERGSAAEIENPRYSLDPTLPLAPMTPSLHVIVLLLVALQVVMLASGAIAVLMGANTREEGARDALAAVIMHPRTAAHIRSQPNARFQTNGSRSG